MSYNQIGILIGICAVSVLGLIRTKMNTPLLKRIWKSVLLNFFLYTLLLIVIEIRWEFILENAKSFDLDNNGFIDGAEVTEEAIRAQNKATSDTGSNFAFITAAFFSLIVSFTIFLTTSVIAYLNTKSNNA